LEIFLKRCGFAAQDNPRPKTAQKQIHEFMKRLLASIFLSLASLVIFATAGCAGGGAQSGNVGVVRVWPGYRTADSFDRISEYFTSRENPGGQIILRTHPEKREGYYFFIRMKTPAGIDGARVVIDVITPASADPKTYTLPAPPLRKGTVLLNPGLTGDDWPDSAAHPTAWRLRLLADDGTELFTQQSYLWSK
jgi:hypothetical protein